jgi:hypothetical protein
VARLLDRHPGGEALGVDAARVAAELELGDEGVARLWSERRRGGVVEVRPGRHGVG